MIKRKLLVPLALLLMYSVVVLTTLTVSSDVSQLGHVYAMDLGTLEVSQNGVIDLRLLAVYETTEVYTEEVVENASEQVDSLDFSNQQVVFNPEDFQSPIEMTDCRVTAYCPCEHCCGEYAWKRNTASGAKAIEGITVAVDTTIIPFGSIVEINGHFYIAQDVGGAVKGVEVDVFIEDTGYPHSNCKRYINSIGQVEGNTIKVWLPK